MFLVFTLQKKAMRDRRARTGLLSRTFRCSLLVWGEFSLTFNKIIRLFHLVKTDGLKKVSSVSSSWDSQLNIFFWCGLKFGNRREPKAAFECFTGFGLLVSYFVIRLLLIWTKTMPDLYNLVWQLTTFKNFCLYFCKWGTCTSKFSGHLSDSLVRVEAKCGGASFWEPSDVSWRETKWTDMFFNWLREHGADFGSKISAVTSDRL